jgi:hypothetical protein
MTLWYFTGQMHDVLPADIQWLAGVVLLIICLIQRASSDRLVWRSMIAWSLIVSSYLLRVLLVLTVMMGCDHGVGNSIRLASLTHTAARTFIIPVLLTMGVIGVSVARIARAEKWSFRRILWTIILQVSVLISFALWTSCLWRQSEPRWYTPEPPVIIPYF